MNQNLIESIHKSNLRLGLNDVSNRDYHADNSYLSSSSLKDLLFDPAKFHREKILKVPREREMKSSFDIGSYVHSLILEPHLVAEEYAIYDGAVRAGKKYEAFAQEHPNKTILTVAQRDSCNLYYEAFLKNQDAVELIKGGCSEHTLCNVLDGGVPIKTRYDYFNLDGGYIADIKTSSAPVDKQNFVQTVGHWHYDISAALYVMNGEEFYSKPLDFYFVSISKKTMQCEVFYISDKLMADGRREVARAFEKYKHGIRTNDWGIS